MAPLKTILLIEDDPDMRQNTAEMLELEGYRVVKAENGKRGVELAQADTPDLVLCDITMPELDGYGVLHALGRTPRTAEVPFIFLSAKTEHADVRKGMDLGADDYLTKPVKSGDLLSAIEGRLKRSELFRRNFGDDVVGLDRFMEQARGLDALKDLGKGRKMKKVGKQESLFREGDELEKVPYLIRGKVRTFKTNKDGKEFVTGLHGEGEFIGYMGLLESGCATENAETIEDSEISLIPSEDLLALMYRDRDVSMRFIKMLARDMQDKEVRLLQLAYASVRQRVAQSLLRIHQRYAAEETSELGVRISREDLASIVGIATESLIRCLADLKEEGLIGIQGREIRIIQKEKLEKLAH